MRIAVTGTPGTGKTTATDLLADERGLRVLHLNDLIREEGLHAGEDETRGSLIADLERLADRVAEETDAVLDSHLAHHLEADRVVVLRCAPAQLEQRLRERGEPPEKAHENAEAEALDVILSEAVATHGRERVFEIDTTDRTPAAVAADIAAVIDDEREPSAGEVDFTDYL